jgi:hypothetical protein
MTAQRLVRHIVMWRLCDAESWQRLQADGSAARLFNAMRADVPGLLRLDVGMNAAPSPDAADLVLYTEFSSWDALRAYEVHPLHDDFKAMLRPLRSERRVVDFEIPVC